MKSLRRIGGEPISLALPADEIVEFHLARILLLLQHCGVSNRIDGLTKMAKLDFFVRYPDFFRIARQVTGANAGVTGIDNSDDENPVESTMIRHHYGPWDKRYYQVLAHLEAKSLISVVKDKSSYRLTLTSEGKKRAEELTKIPSFASLVERMKDVKKTFGSKSGDSLKKLIYQVFDLEVRKRQMGGVISR
jgi:hypothetical protein